LPPGGASFRETGTLPMTDSRARILVVDDNEALRENLAEALELEGYQVAVAQDGEHALAVLAEEPPPRAVLLDLMMPGIDGHELLTRIREDPRLGGVRVVMTTGLSGVRARLAAADAVLTKPFGVRDLLAVLERVGVRAP
jgi:CheY-like chemotaxis protein